MFIRGADGPPSILRELTLPGVYDNVIHAMAGKSRTTSSVLSVRVSSEERALLEAASSRARTNLSDFVRRKAIDAAELDVMEHRIVTIPAESWEEFEAWANRPAEDIPALRELLSRPPTWQA